MNVSGNGGISNRFIEKFNHEFEFNITQSGTTEPNSYI